MIPGAIMLRLCAGLCAVLFLVLRIAGEDTGQTRAGLRPAEAAIPAARPMVPRAPPLPELPLVLPLVKAAPPEAPQKMRYVWADTVNLREGPSTEFAVVGQLPKGALAQLLWTEGNGWAHIAAAGNGLTGYVAAELLSESAP